MTRLKSISKKIIPHSLWAFARSIYLNHRTANTPKAGQFGDSEQSLKAIGAINAEWKRRIRDVISCPDNDLIPRCPTSGIVHDGTITMHNGIKVGALSYYGAGIMNLLIQNKGVHEPQEELAFGNVLPYIAEGGVMLELGAYWGFYSLWFSQAVKGAKNFLVEPVPDNLEAGKFNFSINGKEAIFENAFAGKVDSTTENAPPTVSVDSFLRRHSIERLAILHSDVQGAEVDVLHGASDALSRNRIDYLFISTHGNDLHAECVRLLENRNYRILVSANLDDSYADDGLIVAMSPLANGPAGIEVSHKSKAPKRRP